MSIIYKPEFVLPLLFVLLTLTGCNGAPDATDEVTAESSQALTETESVMPGGSAGLTGRQMQMWSASCALCHVDGTAGAPIVGIAEHWQPRVARGMETLIQHTVEGFNSMPPLGYCMACEKEDFNAMILFMSKNHSMSGSIAGTGESE